MRCSEPGGSVVVAIIASRAPGRWAHLWGSAASACSVYALRLGVFAPLRFAGVGFNAETQRREDAERICPGRGGLARL